MSAVVAVLYVDPRGPYPAMADVDPWDERRDARKYDGPLPVVVHPPCGPWSSLRYLSRGAGRECAPLAVEQVRRWGGVLEHPAGSRLWTACKLPVPGGLPDEHGGYSVEVAQVSWGHVARKRTWLYMVGVPRERVYSTLLTGGSPTHWVSGGRNPRHGHGTVPPGIKVCSAQQRRRTPPAFAEWLVSLARASRG